MTTGVETDVVVEIDNDFNLEDELLDHLAQAESAQFIHRERFSPELIDSRNDQLRSVLQFVLDYADKYKSPPPVEVMELEFGIRFEQPKAEIEWVVEKYRDRYKRNKAKEILLAASRKVGSDPDEASAIAISNLTQLQALTTPRRFEIVSEDWSSQLDEYKKRVLEGRTTGFSFGWDEVDEDIGGLKIGELAYILGRPKRFKSWTLLKSAIAVQHHPAKSGRSVLFTLEMSEATMMGRYMCMVAGVSYKHWVDGTMAPEENRKMEECADWIESLGFDQQIVFAHPPRGQRTVGALRQYAIEHGADVVYIDQLSFLETTRQIGNDKPHMAVEYINEDLREAVEDFPIYIAAQFNREAANMTEMADLSKIGLSDSVGQKADILLGLYQSKDMQENNIVEFGVIEARNYGIHRWDIGINFHNTSFYIDRKKSGF